MSDYLNAYRDGYERFGSAFEVTLWASPRTQHLRFEIFAEMVNLRGKRVLDAGCSRGDFAQWMLDQQVQYDRYIGVDGLEQVVAYARTRKLPRAEFHAGDFLANPKLLAIGDPQVVCISGTLNTMTDEQALTLLEAAWDAAGSELVFNFLPDTAGPGAPLQEDVARRLSTHRLLDWAFDKTWNVIFRQDYFPHGHDATIRMRR